MTKKTPIPTIIMCIILFLVAVGIIGFSCYRQNHMTVRNGAKTTQISNRKFMKDYNSKKIKQISFAPNRKNVRVSGTLKNGHNFNSVITVHQLNH